MTDEQWAVVEQLLAHGWSSPRQWGPAAASAYRLVLDGYEPDQVVLAMQRLIQRGGAFRPTIAEVVAALEPEQAASVPTWDEVYAAIWEKGGVSWTGRLDGVHELVALYVERRGGIDGVRREKVADPDYRDAVLQRLKQNWEELLEQVRAREREGRALEALGRSRRGKLSKPDWRALTEEVSPTTPTPIDAPAPTGGETGARAHSGSEDRLHSRDLPAVRGDASRRSAGEIEGGAGAHGQRTPDEGGT